MDPMTSIVMRTPILPWFNPQQDLVDFIQQTNSKVIQNFHAEQEKPLRAIKMKKSKLLKKIKEFKGKDAS